MSTPAQQSTSFFDGAIARRALVDAFRKLDPRELVGNPVILAVEVVTVLVTGHDRDDQPDALGESHSRSSPLR